MCKSEIDKIIKYTNEAIEPFIGEPIQNENNWAVIKKVVDDFLMKMVKQGYLKAPDYTVTIEEDPNDPYKFILDVSIPAGWPNEEI